MRHVIAAPVALGLTLASAYGIMQLIQAQQPPPSGFELCLAQYGRNYHLWCRDRGTYALPANVPVPDENLTTGRERCLQEYGRSYPEWCDQKP
jgi:hypothetical protein